MSFDYDFKCILECKIINSSINPSLILKNIKGNKKIDLIGSDVDEIDLNLLLPETFRDVHNKLMIDVITNGQQSQYWTAFMNGKMQRSIDIINPIDKKIHNVKLNINFKSQNKNLFIFDVIITDITNNNKTINKTGLITHDLRAVLKSALNIICEIEEIPSTNIEQTSILKDLINEALNMCLKTNTLPIPENITENKEISYLNKNQIKLISSINENKKTILLVDDILFNLKLICLKLIKKYNKKYEYSNFPILTKEGWQEYGIFTLITDECQYILASNGMYGKEICQIIKVDVIITDIQMPELNGIDMIKYIGLTNLKSKIFINSAVVDNNNYDIIELLKNPQITFVEKGNFNWISDV